MGALSLTEAYKIVSDFEKYPYEGKQKTLSVLRAEEVIREHSGGEVEAKKKLKRKLKLQASKIMGFIEEIASDKDYSEEDKKYLVDKFSDIRSYFISLNKKAYEPNFRKVQGM